MGASDERSRAPTPLIRRKAIGSGVIATEAAMTAPSPSAAVQRFDTAIGAGLHEGPIAEQSTASHRVQRQASGGSVTADAGGLLEAASRGSGAALPTAVQRKFEASLGADLSGVRVHQGEPSAQASTAISARAYTVGQHIHFNAGQYDPTSSTGEHLLAHEVAHTVQQSSGATAPQCKLEVSESGDACELEADRAADAMTSGRTFSVGGSAAVHRSIMRTPEDGVTGGGSASAAPGPRGTEATSGASGASAADGGTAGAIPMVATTWTINYDLRGDVAGGREAHRRTEADALHVRSFTVTPDAHPVSPQGPFSGYSLRAEGPVVMGTRQHPRGEAGTASASIAYLGSSEVHLRATGSRAALAAHGGAGRIAARVRAALLRDSAATLIPDSAACTAALTDAERGVGLAIEATSREGASRTVAPIPLRYPAIQQDGQAMHVMVHVPTGERRVIVEGDSSDDHEVTAGTSASHTGSDSVESGLTTETRARIASELEVSFQETVTRFSREVTENFFHGRLSASQSGTISGEGSAGLSVPISLGSLPLSAILLAIPGLEEFAPFVGDAALTAGITPDLRVTLGLSATATLEEELVAEHRATTEQSLQTAITRGLQTRWTRETSTAVGTSLTTRHSDEATDGHTGGTRDAHHESRTSRSEGESRSQVGAPELVLMNTVAAAPVAPVAHGPIRIE